MSEHDNTSNCIYCTTKSWKHKFITKNHKINNRAKVNKLIICSAAENGTGSQMVFDVNAYFQFCQRHKICFNHDNCYFSNTIKILRQILENSSKILYRSLVYTKYIVYYMK